MKAVRKLLLPLLLVFVIAFQSCHKDEADNSETNDTLSANRYLYSLMHSLYLWYEYVPTVNPDTFDNPEVLIDSLKYDLYDRWSYVTTQAEWDETMVQGAYIGHGCSFKADANDSLKIAFVFSDSPMAEAGVCRGWKVIKVNGTNVELSSTFNINTLLGASETSVVNDFVFIKPTGDTVSLSIGKREVDMNTVLLAEVVDVAGTKVAHLVLQSFITKTPAELDTAFAYFKEQGATELVLDLRYNTGGTVSASQLLASYIGGTNVEGKVYVQMTHNNIYSSENSSVNFTSETNALNLSRVFVITTQLTASASEAVINGLKPHINVITIGDRTHGKPVGMYAISKYNYVYLPIAFKLTNSEGYGDYFDGLSANKEETDDLSHDFNNQQESCYSDALYYISQGSFPARKQAFVRPTHYAGLEMKGLREIIGAY
jgi:carboxyl-terminal processing protease